MKPGLGGGGGGGLLSLEKGTNCGPTTLEQWLSRNDMAEKGGCPVIEFSHGGAVIVLNVSTLD